MIIENNLNWCPLLFLLRQCKPLGSTVEPVKSLCCGRWRHILWDTLFGMWSLGRKQYGDEGTPDARVLKSKIFILSKIGWETIYRDKTLWDSYSYQRHELGPRQSDWHLFRLICKPLPRVCLWAFLKAQGALKQCLFQIKSVPSSKTFHWTYFRLKTQICCISTK